MTAAPVRGSDIEVARATPADADAIRAVPGLGGSTRRLLDHDLAAADRRCLVARRDGRIVGFAAGLLQLDEAHVLDIAVQPPLRRRGIGRQLLVMLLGELAAAGAVAVTLEVRASDPGAQALYRQLGFVQEGRRPGYYPDGDDALLLWLRDLQGGAAERMRPVDAVEGH